MWQPVPWFVAGGLHQPEIARLLAYAATGGNEGIVGVGDCKVRPMPIPDGRVRVAPGGAVIRTRHPGAAAQSYVARNPEDDVVELTPTGSSGGRTDLIVARIEDPEAPGVEEPEDPTVGPYVFTRVIEGVPANVRRVRDVPGHENDSALAIARIARPASTGTIQESHITDLREMAQIRRQSLVRAVNLERGDTQRLTATSGSQVFPSAAQWDVRIPEWANRIKVIVTWSQIQIDSGHANGVMYWQLGWDSNPLMIRGRNIWWRTPGSNVTSRHTFVAGDDLPIPAAARGALLPLNLRANRAEGSNIVAADDGTAVTVLIEFEEVPE